MRFLSPPLGQAEALRSSGRPVEALSVLPRVDGNSIGAPSTKYARARVLVDLGEYVEAKVLLHAALDHLDNVPDRWVELREKIWNELGIIYRRMNRLDLAVNALVTASKCAKQWTSYVQAAANLGMTYLDMKNEVAARKIFGGLLAQAPQDESVLMQCASFERSTGNLTTAQTLLQRACMASPSSSSVHRSHADVLCDLKAWEQALLECDLAIKTGVDWPDIGGIIFFIVRFRPDLTSSRTYIALISATGELDRARFAQEAASRAELCDTVAQSNVRASGTHTVTSKLLWVPPAAGLSRVDSEVEDDSREQKWLQYSVTRVWFDSIREDLDAVASKASEVLSFADLALELGRADEALSAVGLIGDMAGVDSDGTPYVLRARTLASEACLQQGDRERAWDEAVAALQIADGLDEQQHIVAIDSLYAVALQSSGVASGGVTLDLRARAVNFRSAAFGSDHPGTLRARHNYAFTLDLVGRYADAAVEMEEVLRLRRRVLGYNADETFNSTYLLSGIVGRSGDWTRALWLAEQAWHEAAEIYGTGNEIYWRTIVQMAECMARCGDVQGAIDFVEASSQQLQVSGIELVSVNLFRSMLDESRNFLQDRLSSEAR